MALHIIEQAEREGRLKPGSTIVENTSGNTGMGLALIGSVKGYRLIFTMPDKMSQEKINFLRAFGAKVVVTPTNVPADHPDSYYETAKRIAAETPGSSTHGAHCSSHSATRSPSTPHESNQWTWPSNAPRRSKSPSDPS